MGDTKVSAGGLLYVKPATRVSVPLTFVTVTSTAPGTCAGVTAVNVLESTNVTDAAGPPSKVTVVEAVKFDPLLEGPAGYTTQSYSAMIAGVVEVVGAVREGVGWDVDIALEIHRKLGVGEAKALAEELRQFRIFMYEDSIPPDSLDSHAEVANSAKGDRKIK